VTAKLTASAGAAAYSAPRPCRRRRARLLDEPRYGALEPPPDSIPRSVNGLAMRSPDVSGAFDARPR